DGQMVAFDSNTGEPKWRTRLKGRVTEAPAIADELCVVADDLGWVYHVRLADGKSTESKRVGAPGRVAYDIRKGVLHYLDGAGVMHFVRLKRAEPKVVEEKVTEERVVRRKKAVKRKVVKTNKPTTQSLKVDQTVHLGELNWDTIVKHSEGSMLRGAPSRHGLVKGHGLTQLDSVAWSFKTPSGVFAQPVLALGGEVLVIADTSGNVYGLEEATGRKRWHFKAKSAVWGTPACAGGVACFGDYQKNFYALDVETGNLAWQFKADGDVFSSAIIVDELVYFNTNKGVVYALDLETGTIDWKEEVTKGSMFPSPGIWGRRIFVGGNKGPLVALNRHNGIQRWERKLKLVDYTIPTCSEEFIYVNTTEGAVALEPENGKTIWKSKFGKGDAQPALSPEFVYLTDSQQMVALDPLEGKKEWEYKKRFGYSAPVVCGDMVYAGTYGDGIVALNRFTGKKLWSHKTNRDVWSTVLVHDEGGKIVVADYGGTVYSLHLRQNGAHEHQIPPRISLFPPL
ncbi:MAG TPA: hypothetical protein DCE42_18230, partial [Myxococcales bacterium]|nr:hypothetical protein [Myxococcales bacterium]